MRTSVMIWGGCGLALVLGGAACSGTSLHDVGDINGGTGGAAGSAGVGPVVGGGASGSGGAAGSNSTVGGASGSAGNGGAGGSNGLLDPQSGAGGEPDNEPLECPACVTVATGQDVRGIAANDQDVFWVDYGTSDALGNYENNGRLLARSLAGGATSVIADSLPGPESVSLSSHYAYVFVNQRTELNHAFGLVRVPLAGGAAQAVQDLVIDAGNAAGQFVSTPGYEYWNLPGAVYRIAEVDNASAEIFVAARSISRVFADDTQLYFQDPAGVWTVPFTGGEPTQLSTTDQWLDLQLLNGDYLYALETPPHPSETGTYLTRMPKVGGAWKRVYLSPNGQIWSQVAIDGDRYFIDEPTATQWRILQRSLATPTTEITLASKAYSGNESWTWKAWAYSNVGIFFADPTGLYLTPTSP